MAVRNLVVNYAAAATVSDVLNALLDAFTSTGAFAGTGLGFTLLEDSIAGSSLFVVQAQQPGEVKSRMIIEVRYANISATDYIAFVLWDSWTPGAPGSGGDSVQLTNPTLSPTTSTTRRFHLLDLTNGGNFWLDGNDATGVHCVIHSEANSVVNQLGHFIAVCSIERSFAEGNLGVNYGVLAFSDSGVSDYLQADTAAEAIMWIPPINHVGNVSNNVFASPGADQAVYMCMIPVHQDIAVGGTQALTGRGSEADTYNGGELIWPLLIANTSQRRGRDFSAPAGTAFGYRGICQGVFGYSQGAAVGFRSDVLDDTTGQTFLAYTGDGLDGNHVPCFLVDKA
jgi:hypothetical protein